MIAARLTYRESLTLNITALEMYSILGTESGELAPV